MTIEINDDSFEEEVLQANIPVLVDFWADWCMPCKMIAPILDELAKEFAGKVKITKINTDQNFLITSRQSITAIPALLIFSKGQLVDKLVGNKDKKTIKNAIMKVLEKTNG